MVLENVKEVCLFGLVGRESADLFLPSTIYHALLDYILFLLGITNDTHCTSRLARFLRIPTSLDSNDNRQTITITISESSYPPITRFVTSAQYTYYTRILLIVRSTALAHLAQSGFARYDTLVNTLTRTDVGRNTKRKRKETSKQRSIYLVCPFLLFFYLLNSLGLRTCVSSNTERRTGVDRIGSWV
jgi:hypothetical protein